MLTISYVILKYAPYDWLKYRGMAILVCRKNKLRPVTLEGRAVRACMNGAHSGGWFIESQRIGARTCKITSNVLHQD